MNERIRELVRQAGLDDADFPIEDWDNVPLARYTELIVRECMGLCYGIDTEYEGKKVKPTVIASKVAEHFGVEE